MFSSLKLRYQVYSALSSERYADAHSIGTMLSIPKMQIKKANSLYSYSSRSHTLGLGCFEREGKTLTPSPQAAQLVCQLTLINLITASI